MKILHVVTLCSDDGSFGGPSTVALNQASSLHFRGHHVELVSLWKGQSPSPTTLHGIPVKLKNARTLVPGTGFSGLLNVRLVYDIASSVRQAEVVHVHAGRDLVTVVALAICYLLKTPYIVQTHGMIPPSSRLKARVFDGMLRGLLSRVSGVMALTTQEKTKLAEVLPELAPRISILRNGVHPSTIPRGLRNAEPTIVFVARMHERKRPTTFVEAALSVLKLVPNVRFKLYGPDDGALRAALKMIKSLPENAAGRITYEGALSSSEVKDVLLSSDVYVLPSVDEPFPMSFIEALALGTPAVGTAYFGISDQLRAAGAAVITDGSAAEIADGVRMLLDPCVWRRYSDAGRNIVQELYSMSAVVDRLEQTYSHALMG